jgi:L-amino acid N-acyltransferase YncA
VVAANSAFSVRVATANDAVAIARIHTTGIAQRIAMFATEPRTAEQVAQQLTEKGERFPTAVVELDGQVVAGAAVGSNRDRTWYAGIGEHSVDVDRFFRGRGARKVARDARCRACAARGLWKLVSRIFPEIEASITLHERAGFRVVGIYRKHGKLGDEWRDCVIVEKLLTDDEATER